MEWGATNLGAGHLAQTTRAPFVIGEPERDAWLRHMGAALDSLVLEHGVHPVVEARLLDYFAMTADAMVNAR